MPYLIDGHNLVAQTPGLSLADPDDERKLVALLRAYLGRARRKGTVVFDQGQLGAPAIRSTSTLQVRFARPPRTADDVIVDLLRAEHNPRGLRVVSADHAITAVARHRGAAVVSPASFARAMLASPAAAAKTEGQLSPEEIKAWEELFKKRPNLSD